MSLVSYSQELRSYQTCGIQERRSLTPQLVSRAFYGDLDVSASGAEKLREKICIDTHCITFGSVDVRGQVRAAKSAINWKRLPTRARMAIVNPECEM